MLGLLIPTGCSEKVQEAPLMPSAKERSTLEVDPEALVEGNIEAWGLRFPKDAIIQERTPARLSVLVHQPLERVSTYFRERLVAESINTGPRATVFENARLRSGQKGLVLKVTVIRRGTSTLVHATRDDVFATSTDAPPVSSMEGPPEAPPPDASAP